MKFVYTVGVLFICNIITAQKNYFQQEVNYKIDVQLQDSLHILSGNIEIEYVNNSPDRLDSIYFHLWGNAFQNRRTAFAVQQLREGNTKFYFTDDDDLGGYSNLNFVVNGQKAILVIQPNNPDIAVLHLPKPLESQQKITIQTPFTLKIPASFSRLGHVGESYQMTQWYPKPAVYDADGWHPMPNLDMGEYYSEFGNFDVIITLPVNYIVAATGVLQTKAEQNFLQEKVKMTNTYLENLSENRLEGSQEAFPPSSSTLKTIRYTAENVHDFAWFADKRFKVQKGEITLKSGKPVDTWVFFTEFEQDLWKDAIGYVNRAVKFYSDLVGEYPYPHATAVQSALSAGAGMEYPMITVIGEAFNAKGLDIVITHEVGHNWFYGILANNERDHAWMDEGINSYYEKRYVATYYNEKDVMFSLPDIIQKGSNLTFDELTYLWQARHQRDQAPETTSNDFNTINYYLSAYEKPAMALQYLETYTGKDRLDAAMQQYYQQWQFKHPQPFDFREIMEKSTNENLTWLFDGLLYSNLKLDYAITNIQQSDKYKITVVNKGNIAAPFPISGLINGEVVQTKWYQGVEKEQTIDFPLGNYDLIVIDATRVTLDVNRKNNNIRPTGIFRKVEPLALSFLPGAENELLTQVFWSPALAWNNYDKLMLGAMIHNYGFPFKKFQFFVAPVFSFVSQDIAGVLDVQYHMYPRTQALQRVTLGLTGRTFHYDRNTELDYDIKYARLMPYVTVDFNKKPASNFFQNVQWHTIWLNTQTPQFNNEGKYVNNKWGETFIHELSYFGESRRVLNPFSINIALEQQSYESLGGKAHYLKASLEWNSSFTYAEKKNIDIRVFGGFFIENTKRHAGGIFPGAFNLTSQGWNDYRFDDYYFGRTDFEGSWSRQVTIREGGMKNVIGGGFYLGRSNSYIMSLNLKTDLPMRLPLDLPLKPYFDIGYFDNAQPTGVNDTLKDQLMWSGGITLEVIDNALAIYFPFIYSKNIQDRYAERGNYWQRVAFTIDLKRLNPLRFVERLDF